MLSLPYKNHLDGGVQIKGVFVWCRNKTFLMMRQCAIYSATYLYVLFCIFLASDEMEYQEVGCSQKAY